MDALNKAKKKVKEFGSMGGKDMDLLWEDNKGNQIMADEYGRFKVVYDKGWKSKCSI